MLASNALPLKETVEPKDQVSKDAKDKLVNDFDKIISLQINKQYKQKFLIVHSVGTIKIFK